MFFDGLVYASIARNLALGRGAYWQPHFTETLYPVFYEHPPLLFWVQSLGFHFSPSVFVEKGFCALVFATTVLLLFRLLRTMAPRNAPRVLVAACTVIPWLCYSETPFVHANNLLEGPLGLFALAATISFLQSTRARTRTGRAAWLGLGSVLVAAGVLTKGLPALFPLVVPVADGWLGHRGPPGRALLASAGAAALTGGLLAALFAIQPEAREFLHHYWNQQVAASLTGGRGGVGPGRSLLSLAGYILEATAPSLILLGAIAVVRRWRGASSLRRAYLRPALVLGAIALSGSVPLAVSARVSAYYLAPSLLYYAGAFGFLAAALTPPLPCPLAGRIWRFLRSGLSVLLVAGLVWLAATPHAPARDESYLNLVRTAATAGVGNERVGAPPGLRDDWALHAYLQRYLGASLDSAAGAARKYYVLRRGDDTAAPPGFEPVPPATSDPGGYVLYQRSTGRGPAPP